MAFVHLQTHSEFSILQASARLDDILAAAAAENVEYIDFYEEMRQVADNSFFAPWDTIHPDEKGFNFITLKILEYLAQNNKIEERSQK